MRLRVSICALYCSDTVCVDDTVAQIDYPISRCSRELGNDRQVPSRGQGVQLCGAGLQVAMRDNFGRLGASASTVRSRRCSARLSPALKYSGNTRFAGNQVSVTRRPNFHPSSVHSASNPGLLLAGKELGDPARLWIQTPQRSVQVSRRSLGFGSVSKVTSAVGFDTRGLADGAV